MFSKQFMLCNLCVRLVNISYKSFDGQINNLGLINVNESSN